MTERPTRTRAPRLVLAALATSCTFAPPGGSPATLPGPADGDDGTDAGSGGPPTGGSAEGDSGSGGPGPPPTSTDPDPDTTGGTPPGDWWNVAWSHRQRIDLSPPAGSALPDFPLVVRIDLAAGEHAAMARDAADVRFVDDDGRSVLAHEVEAWVRGVAAVFWVKLPQLDPDTDGLWMYWGNPEAEPQDEPAAVWSAGYAAVWHMNVDPTAAAPQVKDSVGGHHGTLAGDVPAGAAADGRVGPGLEFDGVDDFADMGDVGGDAWTGITLEAWIRPLGDSERVLCKATSTAVDDHTWCLAIPSGDLQARLGTDGAGGAVETHDQLAEIAGQSWSHIAWTWSNSDGNVRAYVDGEEVASEPHGGDTIVDSTQIVAMANVNGEDNRFTHGVFDEVRISSVAHRPAWLSAQFLAMTGELLALGPVEALP